MSFVSHVIQTMNDTLTNCNHKHLSLLAHFVKQEIIHKFIGVCLHGFIKRNLLAVLSKIFRLAARAV